MAMVRLREPAAQGINIIITTIYYEVDYFFEIIIFFLQQQPRVAAV